MSFFDLKGMLQPLGALKQLGKNPHTIGFGDLDRDASDRYRGLHHNDLEACIGCGNCSTICQNAAIDMINLENIEGKNGDSGLRPRVDNGRCCWCALCVEVCPTGSLNLTKDYIFVSESVNDFLWTPGVDNPKAKEEGRLSFTSSPEESLSDYTRVPMREMPEEDRTKSFAEVVLGYSQEEAQKEASRCISCSLCTEACPDHMHIPEYINAIAKGDDASAVKIIYDNNPLPEMCGKVCTRQCETVCALTHRGEENDPNDKGAVAIRWLKRYATETVPTIELMKEVIAADIAESNGKKISIIGAGPSGLTVGYYLALKGYDVTIYEAKAKGGGMVMYGIPKYRLPLESLDKQIGYMQEMGVKIHFNTKVGVDIQFDEIYENSDAIFAGIGFQVGWTMGMEGEDGKGSMTAVDYLDIINRGDTCDVGKKVAVIGGGNVAIDAARVSRRHGAEVAILYRRRIQEMPADWEEIIGAQEENIELATQCIPTKIIKDKDNKVIGVEYLKAEMKAAEDGGRARPVPIEGSETIYECDTVMAAIGQEADYGWLPEKYREKVEIKRGMMITNEGLQTGDPKIFAGGDAVNKVADAISAIADGFNAVKSIEEFLKNK